MMESDQPFNSRAIEERYLSIKERVWRAAQRHGREPASIKLVAVTKTFQDGEIEPVLHQGHRCFGENRVQEATRKWPGLRERFPTIELHLIGPLQSNIESEAVALFDCIETLDRPKLAAALASEIQRQGKAPRLLIQVNIGLEPRKAGIAPADTPAFVKALHERIQSRYQRPDVHSAVRGRSAPHFEKLGALAGRLGLSGVEHGDERRL